MIITIIIFFIAILVAFGMLSFRAWQIRTSQIAPVSENGESRGHELSFRQIEKNMLYLTKHIVQALVLTVAKYWFIFITKTKKWVMDKWPKVHSLFQKKPSPEGPTKPSFIQRAVLESKSKIKRIKERVKEEHE